MHNKVDAKQFELFSEPMSMHDHDDVLLHFSSNSSHSDPSLPSKLAKLEARMSGKFMSSAIKPSQDSAAAGNAASSDSDEDGAGDFMIQANPQKRKASTDAEEDAQEESSKRKSGRGRGRGRGRVSKSKDAQNETTVKADNVRYETTVSSTSDQTTKGGSGDDEKTRLQEELASLTAKCSSFGEELNKARLAISEHQNDRQQWEKEMQEMKESLQQKEHRRSKVVSDLLIAVAKGERQESRLRVRQDSVRLGNVGVMRAGSLLSEVWEDGQALKDIQLRIRSLMEQKESIEKQRKLLKRRQNGQADKSEASDGEQVSTEEEYLALEEMYRSRLFGIKREEESALRDRDRYELEKACHIRELKRIRDEDGSRFNHFPILHKRYALLNLIGKGGFSEVFKAYDMTDYRYVACKLHGLNVQWSEEKKQSYIRHAIREYNIHKNLTHPHIVRLWDTFEIDHNTFCTVLQYCGGKDLDAVLKATSSLAEREARSIMVQIFSGLIYLNQRSQRIIHYDLKPANILFDQFGAAKMTDFGLSKIVQDEVGSQGMELTSQGAGTYWYLPPECFDVNKTPLISSKVDVWSAGVLFYQMLFGKRPFGHDQSQERILREDTIIKAHRVEFPSRPTVSPDAKEFIRRCLSYNQADRPDVMAAAHDPYLSYVKRKP